jgi:hypothetical protein
MKAARLLLAPLMVLVAVTALPAWAQVLYENGPIDGQTDAWALNFMPADSFTISSGSSSITGLSFGTWLYAGDTLLSAEVVITQSEFGGTTYFDQQVNFTASSCFVNQYGYNVCTETGSFSGPTLANGTYWLTLENAVTDLGYPTWWDQNDGVGCHSPGCPSQAGAPELGSLPSESFSILGTPSSGQGSVPEPGSLALVAGSLIAAAGVLRRKHF